MKKATFLIIIIIFLMLSLPYISNPGLNIDEADEATVEADEADEAEQDPTPSPEAQQA